MAKDKITQASVRAFIKKRKSVADKNGKCPHCVNGKIGNAVCAACKGK